MGDRTPQQESAALILTSVNESFSMYKQVTNGVIFSPHITCKMTKKNDGKLLFKARTKPNVI